MSLLGLKSLSGACWWLRFPWRASCSTLSSLPSPPSPSPLCVCVRSRSEYKFETPHVCAEPMHSSAVPTAVIEEVTSALCLVVAPERAAPVPLLLRASNLRRNSCR